jgi:hypothetical protein
MGGCFSNRIKTDIASSTCESPLVNFLVFLLFINLMKVIDIL